MRLILRVLLIVFLSLNFTITYGCNCVGDQTPKNALKKAQKVFVGKVIDRTIISIDTIFEGVVFYQAMFTFRVNEVYKGGKRDSVFTLKTGLGGGDCGYEFQVGQSYLVYALKARRYFDKGEKVRRFYTTNICTRTTSNVDEESKKLKKFRKARLVK